MPPFIITLFNSKVRLGNFTRFSVCLQIWTQRSSRITNLNIYSNIQSLEHMMKSTLSFLLYVYTIKMQIRKTEREHQCKQEYIQSVSQYEESIMSQRSWRISIFQKEGWPHLSNDVLVLHQVNDPKQKGKKGNLVGALQCILLHDTICMCQSFPVFGKSCHSSKLTQHICCFSEFCSNSVLDVRGVGNTGRSRENYFYVVLVAFSLKVGKMPSS